MQRKLTIAPKEAHQEKQQTKCKYTKRDCESANKECIATNKDSAEDTSIRERRNLQVDHRAAPQKLHHSYRKKHH